MGGAPAKPFVAPGAFGGPQGVSPVSPAQAPVIAPTVQPTVSAAPAQAQQGQALAPGQAPPPVIGSPMNPWGTNNGGPVNPAAGKMGLMPTYRMGMNNY